MPPKQPPVTDWETPNIQAQVEAVVARHVMRLIVTIIMCSAAAAAWATKLQIDVNKALALDPKLVQQHEWMVHQHEARLTRLETTK